MATIDTTELAKKIQEFCATKRCRIGNAWECARCPLCRFHTWLEEGEKVDEQLQVHEKRELPQTSEVYETQCRV